MKTNSDKSARLFQDRPLTETPCPAPLYVTGFDKTDYIDPLLRVFLAASLMASLVLCGRELGGAPSRTVVQQTAATAAAPAANCAVCAVPRIKPAVL